MAHDMQCSMCCSSSPVNACACRGAVRAVQCSELHPLSTKTVAGRKTFFRFAAAEGHVLQTV
eukprot:1159406-Pelagomonas_calceolata.AAC.2